VRGVGEPETDRLLAVGTLVDGHSPARVVNLGLLDQRVVRFEQIVANRERFSGYAAKDTTHDGGEKPVFTGFPVYVSL
jgi:hypothetical protein